MSKSLLLLCLCGLTLIATTYIFIINKIMKTKKTTIEIIFISIFGIIFAATGALGYSSYEMSKNLNKENIYIAVQKLNTGDYEEALKKTDLILSNDNNNIEAMQVRSLANNLAGNYKDAEIDVLSFIESTKSDLIKKEKLEQLLKISKVGQGIIDEDINIPINMSQDEEDYGISEENKQEIIHELSNEILESSIYTKFPSQKDVEKLDKIIEIEKSLSNSNYNNKTKEEVLSLSAENENNIEIKKLAVKVLVQTGDLHEAAETMKEIIKKENSMENKLILSDIYANQLRTDINSGRRPQANIFGSTAEVEDKEIKKLDGKILEKQEELSILENKINQETSEKEKVKLQTKGEKLKSEIINLEKEIRTIPLMRTINYIKAQKPILSKSSPDYELQLSKLYYGADEKEQAKKHLKKALNTAAKTEYKSEVTKELQEINGIYEQSSNLMEDIRIAPKVNTMVNKLNNGLIQANDNNLNGEFGNFVVSHIKYSKVDVYISGIDTSNYPEVTAYVNIGEEKQGFWGKRSDFTQNDFYIEDTSLAIDNFTVTRNASDNIDVALVFDKSGSMSGRAIEDAKAAGKSFVNNLSSKQKAAIVTFDTNAYIASNLTSQKDTLSNTISDIKADGGTSIQKGLETGLSVLGTSSGSKTIILLSDGRDSNNTSIDETIKLAKRAGVSVYTVGFGDVDDAYLNGIAQGTGGKYFKADSTAELVDIYTILQKYITNNYIINYKVTKNQDIKDRNLFVKLNKIEGQGNKDYSLRVPEQEDENGREDDLRDKIDLVDSDEFILTSVTNGSILGSEVKNEIFIEINGFNIPKDTKIRFGDKLSSSVIYESESFIKAKLPTDMVEGEYDIIGITPEGKVSRLNESLSIYKSGTLTSLKVGTLNIKANNIQKINDTKYVAKGNVVINGVLRIAGDIDITALNETDTKGEYAAGDVVSKSKMYIAFDNSKNSFIGGLLEGREWIVTNGDFNISSNNKARNKTTLKRSSKFNLDVVLFNLEVGTIYVVPDGLEFTALKFALNDLGGKDDDEKGNKNLAKNIVKSNKYLPVSGEATFKVTEKDILTKTVMKFKFGGDGIKIPYISALPIQDAGITLDTIGPVRKFEIAGKCGLPFVKVSAFNFSYNAYSKNLLMPNEFTVKLSLKDGIPLNPSGNVTLKSLGLGVGTMYDAIENNNWRSLSVVGLGDVGFNLSPISLPLVGKIDVVTLADIKASAKLDLNRLSMAGKLKLLGIQMADGTVIYENKNNEKSFFINTKGELKLGLLVAEFGINGDYILAINGDGLIVDGKVNGYFNNNWKNEKASGSGNATITVNKNTTTFKIVLQDNNNMHKLYIAMDHNANILNLKEKFYIETN